MEGPYVRDRRVLWSQIRERSGHVRLKIGQMFTFTIMTWRLQANLCPRLPFTTGYPTTWRIHHALSLSLSLSVYASTKNKHFPQSDLSWPTPATNYSTMRRITLTLPFFLIRENIQAYYKKLEAKHQRVSESQNWNEPQPAQPLSWQMKKLSFRQGKWVTRYHTAVQMLLVTVNENLNGNWLTPKEKCLADVSKQSCT